MLMQKAGAMDPIRLAHEIGTRFFRYLQSTFYFKDPEFRRSFEKALRAGSLVNGPYLESTPVYRRGKKSGDLLRELIGAAFESGFAAAMNPERSLFSHQEQAIRRVECGRNIVVATGTGSGKTESYLYPILLDLYRETLGTKRRPGVRALVLYPMNALANDQRRRLGEHCARLRDNGSSFSLTFGQYTGETPEDQNDRSRYARQHLDSQLAGSPPRSAGSRCRSHRPHCDCSIPARLYDCPHCPVYKHNSPTSCPPSTPGRLWPRRFVSGDSADQKCCQSAASWNTCTRRDFRPDHSCSS